jgi:2,5-diketo-D-gluconate reductase A
MPVPNVTLNNGVQIPQLGFGVFKIKPEDAAQAVATALSVGYRHIDTAEMYRNEKEVGLGIAHSGVDRSEVFITSKINNDSHGYERALAAFDRTLSDLGMDRIDLILIHWPLPTVGDFVQTWKALERVYAEGRARAIGVSNFQIHHLQRLHDETSVVPAVNQIELHPYLTQQALRSFNADHGIATEAWSPLAKGRALNDPAITALAEIYGKTASQVVLRWHIQLGNIVFPKSIAASRMRENFQIFDFKLSDSDVALISALNRDERTGPDPDVFDWIPGRRRA